MSESKGQFDAYGLIAAAGLDDTRQSGRYGFQAEAEKLILADILPKLEVKGHHTFLDIGCGPGTALIPLSLRVANATGIDHADVVAKIARDNPQLGLTLHGGQFPDVPLAESYDRILAYSVVQCLPDLDIVYRFIDAALGLLAPNGRLLLGDLPNRDRGGRFRATRLGVEIDKGWAQLRETEAQHPSAQQVQHLSKPTSKGSFSDSEITEILRHVRAAGFSAYNLLQNPNLPFGRSREDILIINDKARG